MELREAPALPASTNSVVLPVREAFSVGLQKNPVQSPASPVVQNMRLTLSSEGTPMYKPISATAPQYAVSAVVGSAGEALPASAVIPHGVNISMSEPLKRKRGRPRKYGPDGTMALALTPVSAFQVGNAGLSPSDPFAFKKIKGRPPGSGKKQQMAALGSAGIGFTPHVITVKAGEDVSSKIMAFSQHGSRAICILSANGAISNVTLRQAATSGGTVTYEGRFEILSLSGSFLLTENGAQRSRTGGLSVSLAGPDGRVLGGGVAGLLTAASPVQVVVGSFIADGHKELKQVNSPDPLATIPKTAPPAATTGLGNSSPQSRCTQSESSAGPCSPPNQNIGGCNNNGPTSIVCGVPWKDKNDLGF